ncbi:MAG: transglutaminase family protein, partial [Planctomycetota bacterium]
DRPDPTELAALVDLLADPDTGIADSVSARLTQHGEQARPALERAARDLDALRRSRARRLLEALARSATLGRLEVLAGRRVFDLEQGLSVLGELAGTPEEVRSSLHLLDDWSERVVAHINSGAEPATGFDRPMALVEILAGEVGLSGAHDDYHHPDHVHLHRTIERRRGLPLTLTAIYMFVARRAGLRATPVALPGHVLLRLHSENRSMLVDPFDAGRVRTRKDCLQYLTERGLALRPDWFADATDEAMFQRQLVNLAHSHRLRGRSAEAEELMRVASIVARGRGLHPAADPESA